MPSKVWRIKCQWRGTALTLLIPAPTEELALAKAQRDKIGKKAMSWVSLGLAEG